MTSQLRNDPHKGEGSTPILWLGRASSKNVNQFDKFSDDSACFHFVDSAVRKRAKASSFS
jgi:hypothetical protein